MLRLLMVALSYLLCLRILMTCGTLGGFLRMHHHPKHLKNASKLYIPGMTMMSFRYVPVWVENSGWALMLCFSTTLVSLWQMAYVETPMPVTVWMSAPLVPMMLVCAS
jgi:accessory gene regulator protein AgrB